MRWVCVRVSNNSLPTVFQAFLSSWLRESPQQQATPVPEAVQPTYAVPAHLTAGCATHLAQGQDPLLGPNNTAFQHDEVIGHLTVVDKASLSKERTVSALYKAGPVITSAYRSMFSQHFGSWPFPHSLKSCFQCYLSLVKFPNTTIHLLL